MNVFYGSQCRSDRCLSKKIWATEIEGKNSWATIPRCVGLQTYYALDTGVEGAREASRGSVLKSSDRYEYALKREFYFNRLPLDDYCSTLHPSQPLFPHRHFRPGTSHSLHFPPTLPAQCTNHRRPPPPPSTTFARALFVHIFASLFSVFSTVVCPFSDLPDSPLCSPPLFDRYAGVARLGGVFFVLYHIPFK